MPLEIVGIIPPDDKWIEMKAIWDACDKADVKIPKEVSEFFKVNDPEYAGTIIELEEYCQLTHDGIKETHELDLLKIPKQVRTIRICLISGDKEFC